MNEVLEDFDRTPKKEKKAGDGSDIIIGVKGSGDEADKYFADKKLDEKLFEQSRRLRIKRRRRRYYYFGKRYGSSILWSCHFENDVFFPLMERNFIR